MARSISSVPTTRSSVAETGRSTKDVRRNEVGSPSPAAARSRHSVHHVVGESGSQPKRQSATTFTSGNSAASARAAVDLAVPRSPRIRTPPMRGLTAFRTRARHMRSWPTMAVRGKTTGTRDLQRGIIPPSHGLFEEVPCPSRRILRRAGYEGLGFAPKVYKSSLPPYNARTLSRRKSPFMDPNQEPLEAPPGDKPEGEVVEAHPMDAFLEEEAYGMDSPKRGETRTGTIARISGNDVLVDIGAKSEGVVPASEVEQMTEEQRAELVVGRELPVYVVRTGDRDFGIVLSATRAMEETDWGRAEKLQQEQDVYEGTIGGYNKGGLIVKVGNPRGFIPASQISLSRRRQSEGEPPDKRWGKMVGEPILAKVIEVDRKRNRLILSERAAAREARKALKERLIVELQAGEIRTGRVISLADFGAFVDIGGADGLVHMSEISWKRIAHPRDALEVGQEVQVKVLNVDPERKRISLSMRELLPDPWQTTVGGVEEGQLVEGTLTKLTKFGAFASLKLSGDFEVEGLIHISELSDRRIEHPKEAVQEGQTVTLRVIKIDRPRKRIGLSLKRVASAEYADLDWKTAMEDLEGRPASREEIV